jgi:hypothetical protein
MITGTGYTWVEGAPFITINHAPDLPALVAPANGATGITTPPNLGVYVFDQDEGDALTVTFYGRPVGASGENFTVVVLPDTQDYSANLNGGTAAMFNSQTQWIVDNLVNRNIAFVAHLGNVTEAAAEAEWLNAVAAMSLLENPIATGLTDGIPYGISIGDHDQSPNGDPNGTALYNQHFGVDRFQGRSYNGGQYGSDNDNHYKLFSASGMDFIVIHLEYDTSPEQGVLDWANNLLQTYSSRRAIVVSHYVAGTETPHRSPHRGKRSITHSG